MEYDLVYFNDNNYEEIKIEDDVRLHCAFSLTLSDTDELLLINVLLKKESLLDKFFKTADPFEVEELEPGDAIRCYNSILIYLGYSTCIIGNPLSSEGITSYQIYKSVYN